MTDKGKFALVVGNQEFAITDQYSAEQILKQVLTELLPAGIHVVSKETGNKMPILTNRLGLRAVPYDVDDFIKTNNVVNYTMRPFSAIFLQGFLTKISPQGIRLPYYREDGLLTKLVRAGYVSKEVRGVIEGGTRHTYHYYTATPKLDTLIEEALVMPSDRINPDAKFWYALMQCVTANIELLTNSELQSTVKSSFRRKQQIENLYLNHVLVVSLGCGLLVANKPEDSRLDAVYRDSNVEGRPQLYLAPRAEAALLRQIHKVVKTCVVPRTKGYGSDRKTLPASRLDRNLVKLVPPKELAILYSRKQGSYYKALREDKPVG